MFTNNNDNEANFCESYKSEILGGKSTESKTSFLSITLKLFTILLLSATIAIVSFYGYNYFINIQKSNDSFPPISIQPIDEALVVTEEQPAEKSMLITPSNKVMIEPSEIERVANDVKVAIAKSEMEENNTKKEMESVITVEVPKVALQEQVEITSKVELIIQEEPEDLNITEKEENKSLEVPTSVPEAQYLEELADLSKEIDKERNN